MNGDTKNRWLSAKGAGLRFWRENRDAWFLLITGLGVFGLSVIFNEFGLLHFEWWNDYVTFHLGPEPVWKKIFDSRTLDQGVYAGRELSYLVDHFDMQFLALSVRAGFPLFISITHVLLATYVGIRLARFASRDMGLGSVAGLLIALLFWTTPCLYIHFLMRTAKMLTTAGVVVLVIECWRAARSYQERPDTALSLHRGAVMAAAALVMSFSDRQGFYFLLCAIVLVGLEWGAGRGRIFRDILILLAGVLLLELLYFFQIVPALTKLFWGYSPDFSFNRLPWGDLIAHPWQFAWQGLELLLQTVGYTLGAIPRWAVLALLLWTVWRVGLRDLRAKEWRRHVPLAVILAGLFGATWVMYVLMVLRHPPLLWSDVRTIYYWIPTAALVILGLSSVAGRWVAEQPGRSTALLSAGLFALVLANVLVLPSHRRTFVNGHLRSSHEISVEMRYALRHRGDPRLHESPGIVMIPAYKTLRELARIRTYPDIPWDEFGYGEFYRRTRDSAAPIGFGGDFGGNVDSRFITTTGHFFHSEESGWYVGGSVGSINMRVEKPSNRLRGEVVVRRKQPESSRPLHVDFAIYAQPRADREPRFERWRNQVVLPAGQREIVVPYEIDSSGWPTSFTLDIPAECADELTAGWRNPEITDVGRDSPAPAWLFHSNAPAMALDEFAFSRLLPAGWRPREAWMRNGRVTEQGIELSPGGEIWLKAARIVSQFVGSVNTSSSLDRQRMGVTRASWYKAGRLQLYMPSSHSAGPEGERTFQAWCAEPGGWLVISVDAVPGAVPVVVRVVVVREEG